MDKLPLEVLQNLLAQLPWTQRKQCRLVCRQWSNVMKGSKFQCNNRYYVKGSHSLSNYLKLIQQRELAIQVEILILDSFGDDFDTRMLPILFPNLRKVMFRKFLELRHYDYYESLNRPALELPSEMSSGIEHLQDSHHCELTRLLVSNGLGACLETLELAICALENTPSDIFPLLKDLPVLKSLNIETCPVAIESLETIHSNIPSLEILCLLSVYIIAGELPQEIQPALRLAKLNIWTYDQNYEGKTNWLRYIGRKYTNLKHFNYEVDGDSYCREMKDIYSAEFPALLQSIGPQLESLTLNPGLDRGYNTIRILGDLDCRIKKIGLYLVEDMDGFDALAETSTFRYIQELSLSRVDIDTRLSHLKKMTSLKILKIHFEEVDPMDFLAEQHAEELQDFMEGITIDMNQLFRDLPTPLESVTIGHTYGSFDHPQEGETFDIKKLKFHHITPRGGRIDEFVSKHIPNLQSLALHESIEEQGNITLPNYHLLHLEVSKVYKDLNVRLVTDDQTRMFSVSKWSNSLQSGFTEKMPPLSESEMRNMPYLTINCASVDNLMISDVEARLKSEASVE